MHVVRQVASTNDCSPTAVLLLLLRIVNHWQVEGASIMYFTSGTAARDLLPGGDGFRLWVNALSIARAADAPSGCGSLVEVTVFTEVDAPQHINRECVFVTHWNGIASYFAYSNVVFYLH